LLVTGSVLAVVAGGGIATYAVVWTGTSSAGTRTAKIAPPAPESTHPKPKPPTTRRATTTTTTIPPVKNPADVVMPSPGNGLRIGSRGPLVLLYEARMKALH